jgi:RNA polymerase sigma factor (sigma-70 family)
MSYRLRDSDIADAVQATWLSAYQNIGQLRDPARLNQWVAAIMRRSCLKIHAGYRRQKETPFLESAPDQLTDQSADVEAAVLDRETSRLLRRAMSQLKGKQRELVLILIDDSLSYAEIASRLAMPAGSIGPTRKRACRRLRDLLEDGSPLPGEAA